MTILARLNPARRLVGRLFLWFWITFIFTALATFYAVNVFFEETEIRAPDEREISLLYQARDAILSMAADSGEEYSLEDVLHHTDRLIRQRLIVVDVASGGLLRFEGPPLRPAQYSDVKRLSAQVSPLSLTRRNMELLGPIRLDVRTQKLALFIVKPNGPPDHERSVLYFLCIALVVTILLSYLFARTLVKPITQLQRSSKALAEGNWHTRVEQPAQRRDELGELSRDFNVMASQLEKMWQGQQRLLADISHELRSPLARLQVALGIAHQQHVDPATLKRIEREVERMEALIGQLLTLSRAESAAPQFELAGLDDVFESVLADAQFEAENAGKRIATTGLYHTNVRINRALICSALENVLRNGIRYAETAVHVAFSLTDSHWQVAVTDDGPGLSARDCQSVFAPFYRANLARDRASGGAGLGLAIAKTAVEMHHGQIQAHRSKSGGLTVAITVPLDGQMQWQQTSQRNSN